MSIVTKTGDQGTTDLIYNRRVPKHHPRIEACGTVDELNAALGLARAALSDATSASTLEAIQRDLVFIMGDLATDPADRPRSRTGGFPRLLPTHTAQLESVIARLEADVGPVRGWAMPGANQASAALDFARTVCRRSERRAAALLPEDGLGNPEILIYLNRLGDALWLLARQTEPASQVYKQPSAP